MPKPQSARAAMLAATLLAAALAAATLTACGGGGGGGSGASNGGTPVVTPALVFTPATVSASVVAGTSATLNVVAAVQRPADLAGATVYATVSDSGGVVQPSAALVRDSDQQYHAVLQTAATLPAGTYQGNFSVRLCRDSACASQFSGSPMQLPYNIVVTPNGLAAFSALPALPLTATAHAGGAAPAGGSVAIVADKRDWSASTDAAWVQLGNAGSGSVSTPGSTASGSGNGVLTVGYAIDALAPGQYAATVTVAASDGQSARLPVALTVLPNGLTVSSDGLAFNAVNGAPIPSQVLSFDMDNQVSVPWSVTSDAAWLRATPGSGTTPGATVLAVDASTGPLASGGYSARLTLTAGALAPRTLPVSLTLVPATLSASSNSLALGGVYGRDFLTTQTLTLGLNTVTNSWPWQLAGLPVWANASTSAGSINQSGARIVFTARPSSAAVGTTSAMLTPSAAVNGDTVTAPVLLTINRDQHKLLASETGVALSGTPGWSRLTRTLTVSDNYDNFAGMSAASSQPWLTVTVSGNKLTLEADPASLASDTLSVATVTITPFDSDATAPEPVRVGLWKGTLTPIANRTLLLPYTRVVTDPIRPLAYVHNGGAYVDVYNLFSGQKTATLTGFSGQLGDMAVSPDGSRLYLHDIGSRNVAGISLDNYQTVAQYPLSTAGDQNTRLKVLRPNGVEILLLGDGTAFLTASARRLTMPLTSGGTLAASADGKRVLQQDEGGGQVRLTTLAVDYSELSGGTLFAARVAAASHNGTGSAGQDIAVSIDGSRVYSASAAPQVCTVLNPSDLGVLSYLATGEATPNNIELGSDGRIYCGAATKGSGSDLWIYSGDAATLVTQMRVAASGKQLLPRQLAVSGDGLMLIAITDDGATVLVPLGL